MLLFLFFGVTGMAAADSQTSHITDLVRADRIVALPGELVRCRPCSFDTDA